MSAELRRVIRSETDARHTVLESTLYSREVGFGETPSRMIATVVSELTRNILKYAGQGEVRLRRVREMGRRGIEIEAVDEGPGIADCEAAMDDHYSSGGTLGLGRTNAFFLGGGRALVNALYRTAEELGIRVFYATEARELDMEDGVFRSAKVVSRGFAREIRAGALVLASGGYQANIDWLREAWGDAAGNFIIRGTPYNRGRMLKELMLKGIETVGNPAQCHAVAIDARAPKFDGGIVTRLDCVCFGIVVNKHARRFYDEGEDFWPKRYAIWGRLVAAQPGQIGYALFDAKVLDNFMPSLFPPIKADTIIDLARLADLDPQSLVKTVAEFNNAVRPGSYDPDVLDGCCTQGIRPAKTHWALPLDTPPYYAYPLRPGITFTYLGVKVNEKARVLLNNGTASKNIYAAGEVMAGNILGKGYCAGTGMSIGSVFGRIAGKEAACSQKT